LGSAPGKVYREFLNSAAL